MFKRLGAFFKSLFFSNKKVIREEIKGEVKNSVEDKVDKINKVVDNL